MTRAALARALTLFFSLAAISPGLGDRVARAGDTPFWRVRRTVVVKRVAAPGRAHRVAGNVLSHAVCLRSRQCARRLRLFAQWNLRGRLAFALRALVSLPHDYGTDSHVRSRLRRSHPRDRGGVIFHSQSAGDLTGAISYPGQLLLRSARHPRMALGHQRHQLD